jgi:hypothetical protein
MVQHFGIEWVMQHDECFDGGAVGLGIFDFNQQGFGESWSANSLS